MKAERYMTARDFWAIIMIFWIMMVMLAPLIIGGIVLALWLDGYGLMWVVIVGILILTPPYTLVVLKAVKVLD